MKRIVEIGVEAVEREKLRRGIEGGGAEEIFEVAAKRADGEQADALEVIFEGDFAGAGAPRLDRGVVDDDAIGRARGRFDIG